MKSNPLVYPFTPFRRLDDVTPRDNVLFDTTTSLKQLTPWLERQDLEHIPLTGKNIPERILSLFLHSEVRFGPRSYISRQRSFWLEQIKYFTRRDQPLQFSLLSFPGKVPVPFKTDRTLPDLGELLALQRLHNIARKIKTIYSPGARIHIFTEGALGKFIGIPPITAARYEQELRRFAELLGWHELKFIPLGNLTHHSQFSTLFQAAHTAVQEQYQQRNPIIRKKYRLVYPSIFHLVRTTHVAPKVLAETYSARQKTPAAKRLKKELQEKTDQAIWNYFAFLAVRDELNFLAQRVPHHVALSVSPKPFRLGIQLLGTASTILPHHGVVLDGQVAYLLDVQRAHKKIIRVFLKEDRERRPFFYLTHSTNTTFH